MRARSDARPSRADARRSRAAAGAGARLGDSRSSGMASARSLTGAREDLRLESRNGNDISAPYPELRALGTGSARTTRSSTARSSRLTTRAARASRPFRAAFTSPRARRPSGGAPPRPARYLHDLRPALARRPRRSSALPYPSPARRLAELELRVPTGRRRSPTRAKAARCSRRLVRAAPGGCRRQAP